MKIVCLSDTHNGHDRLVVPDGDLLIHAGDAAVHGTEAELEDFLAWFGARPHRRKIFVAGNHDWFFQLENRRARLLTAAFGIEYLQDSAVEIDGLKFYGSPWQPRFYDWAFNLERGAALAEKWRLIPDDVDVLITHGPPHGILDETPAGELAGCEDLRRRVERLASGGRLKLHVFGHIHHAYGAAERFGVGFVNASNCDEEYDPTRPPIVTEISRRENSMLTMMRTDSENEDFRALVRLLDEGLAVRDGAEHGFYAQFNKIDAIRHVVVAYAGGEAVGCGAFKPFAGDEVEIKRMFVRPERRGRGVAGAILRELEQWAVEAGFSAAVLETGKKQPEAIRLYEKSGFAHIPNYGQYVGMDNSVCLRKDLTAAAPGEPRPPETTPAR